MTAETDPVADLPLIPGSAPGVHPWLLWIELAHQQAAFTADMSRMLWQAGAELTADMINPMLAMQRRVETLVHDQQTTASGLMPVLGDAPAAAGSSAG
ncbi:MAG: hypothetical protein AB7G13_36710 [Lautropia sp.]